MVNINRQELRRYDLFAAIHMYSYRVLIVYSFIYALILLLDLLGIVNLTKVANVALWIVTTPTYYALVRGILMIWSRGLAFGKFPESYRKILEEGASPRPYEAMLYLAMGLWILGFLEYVFLG